MNVDKDRVDERTEFVKLAVNNPCEAAKKLHSLARKLEKTNRSTDTIKVISKIIFRSDRGIYNDLKQ